MRRTKKVKRHSSKIRNNKGGRAIVYTSIEHTETNHREKTLGDTANRTGCTGDHISIANAGTSPIMDAPATRFQQRSTGWPFSPTYFASDYRSTLSSPHHYWPHVSLLAASATLCHLARLDRPGNLCNCRYIQSWDILSSLNGSCHRKCKCTGTIRCPWWYWLVRTLYNQACRSTSRIDVCRDPCYVHYG
jgi:hypothetical protein